MPSTSTTTTTIFGALAALAQAAPYSNGANTTTLATTSSSSNKYELLADYSGPSFFNNFVTYTGPDPTNGHVNYTDMSFAAQQGYVGFIHNLTSDTTSAYIGVDHTSQAPNGRNSVRLVSKDTFNAGSMVVIDVNHIPVQYGLWPAIWMLGTNWPENGESDILEYVHMDTYNAMTLHTAPGCSVSNTSSAFQGRLINTDCNTDSASTGCSVASYSQNQIGRQRFATAGKGFNELGGGVYVHDWQDDGITVWMFPHGDLPSDLISGSRHPNPSSWTTKPLAQFTGPCDFSTALKNMQLIINIDFCGSWAGQADVWKASGAVEATGYSTCNEWVEKNATAFKESYFDIQSVKVYTNNGQEVGMGPTVFEKRDLGRETSAVPSKSAASSTEVSSWFIVAGLVAFVAFLL